MFRTNWNLRVIVCLFLAVLPGLKASAQSTDCFRLSNPFEGLFPSDWGDFSPESAKLSTEDAAPADYGVLEVEFAYSHLRAHEAWGNSRNEMARPFLEEEMYDVGVSYGIWEDWELGLGMTVHSHLLDEDVHPDDSHGIGDFEVGVKYRFLNDESRGFSLAYVPSLTIPAGDEGTVRDPLGHSQEFWAFNQRIAATQNCGRWTWNMDVGYTLPIGDKRADERGTLDTNLAIGYHILPWLQPEVELNYAHDFIDEGQDADLLALTYGLIMPLSEKWRVDTGFQHALAGRNADDFVAGQIAVTYLH